MSLDVLALVPYPQRGASSRYRVYQMLDVLRANDVNVDVQSFWNEGAFKRLYQPGLTAGKVMDLIWHGARRLKAMKKAGGYDLVLIHRQLWPLVVPEVVDSMRRDGVGWLYDLDDAVFLRHVSEANRRWNWLKPSTQYMFLAAEARAVAAGNRWLADWARDQRPGRDPSDVAIVPTAVDTTAWQPVATEAPAHRLVWIGSHSTVGYLDPIRPALQRLARRHPDLELHVIGANFELDGVNVVRHDWSLTTETELVGRCAIGLSPVPDDQWTRGKCGLKLLLYMAMGLPAVASPVGVHREIVTDGEDGRLADTPVAFESAIADLLSDRQARREIGQAARRRVESSYSIRAVGPCLARLLRLAARND
jgi:glycosyltransferase involved in cell wall biosynthesis